MLFRSTPLEFVLAVPGLATTHTYRAPFARSSSVVHLRPERLLPAEAESAGAVVVFSRPRGYFGLPRDTVMLDGATAPGIPPGVAGVSTSKKIVDTSDRPVVAEYRSGDDKARKKKRGFLMGEAMKASKGQGNPQLLNRLLDEKLG